MASIKNYLSLIKFSHTIFALPFAIIGFSLATTETEFSPYLLIYILLCMVFARSAAMAFNRYIDRDIDLKNPRTANVREIPNGTISARSALFFVFFSSFAFVATTYFINSLCFYLSPIALIVVLGYSYTKRFTALCHLVLGLGLGLAPLGAFIAVSSEFAVIPCLLSFTILFWVAGFDIMYALQDDDFDREHKLHSIPVILGRKKALSLSKVFHFLTFLILLVVGLIGPFALFYWIGFVIFSSLLIYQHSIIKVDDLSKIGLAFFTTNGVASVIFGILVVIDLFL